jgi:hypothetical protein
LGDIRGADVLHCVDVLYLPVATFMPKLSDAFRNDAPSLHVAIGKVPARRICGPAPLTEPQRAITHKRTAFALLAEAQPFKAE